jgi:Zn-dependent metalloprotease
MAKHSFAALALALLVAAPPSWAGDPGPAIEAFTGRYGPAAIIALDGAQEGVYFAGRFASEQIPLEPGAAALSFLEQWADMWGYDPAEHLVVGDVSTISTMTYVRLDDVHASIPVEGSGAKVAIDPLGRVRQVVSRFGWSAGYADPHPTLEVTDALRLVAEKMPDLVATGQRRLVYLPGGEHEAPLAWVVRTRSRSGPEAPEVYVDAHTGDMLWIQDTNLYADGNVYDPNPVADPTVYRRLLPRLTSTTGLDGQYAASFSCTAPGGGWDYCPGRVRHAAPDTGGDYLFSPDEPSLTDPFAEVMGYYHLDAIFAHMRDSYGFIYTDAGCGRTGHMPVDVQVNMDYENAWFGDENGDSCADIAIGQGAYDYAYDSSIVSHEFGHGINHTYSSFRWRFDDLGPDPSPTGIDEGFADYWSASISGRPVIGEYASLGTPGELGIRDLADFASCPDNFYGEGHYDSPMFSSCLWEIREAIGQDKADRLGLAVLDSLSSRPTFDEVGRAIQSQAAALESTGVLSSTDVATVDAAVAAHTLVGCERIVVLEDGDRHTFLAPGLYGGIVWASSVQFKLYAPPGATRVTALLNNYGMGDYTVYVRKNQPVRVNVTSGWPPEISIDTYDYRFDGSPDRVTFTEWSDPVLEEDTEYYFTYTHNTSIMLLDVEATIIWFPPDDGSTDAVTDPVTDPAGDVPADVPDDTLIDPTGDATTDAPADASPDPGSITEEKGCGCAIAS